MEKAVNTTFLVLPIDNLLNAKNHIEQMIPKLSGCYAIRLMVYICNFNTFKTICYACFYSVVKCGVILWGNSSNSSKIFSIQKQVIRIKASAQCRTSCTSLFKQRFYLFQANTFINELHYQYSGKFSYRFIYNNVNTRNKHHLNRPNANPSWFQKSTFFAGIKFLTVYHLVRQSSGMTRQNLKHP
jgi:hypothetical protein